MTPSISRRRGSAGMHIDLPPSKLAKFTLFKQLPTEIRWLIWEHALPGPRIIVLEHRRRKAVEDSTRRIDQLGFRADAAPPTILFVCREAYEIASKRYRQAFSNKAFTSIAETYFDFENDVLYLGPEYLGPGIAGALGYQVRIEHVVGHELNGCDLSQIKRLAVWWEMFHLSPYNVRSMEEYLARILCHFGSVKEIIIVSKKYVMPGFRDTSLNMHGQLKFLDEITVEPGKNVQIHGMEIPMSRRWLPLSRVDLRQLKLIRDHGEGISSRSWEIPTINYNVITTLHGEELLLQEAKETRAREIWGPSGEPGHVAQ